MGGATRFMALLPTPFSSLRPSRILLHRRLSALSISALRLNILSSPSETKTLTPQPATFFHCQRDNSTSAIHSVEPKQQSHHPWPEWEHFLNILANRQGFSATEDHKVSSEDAFVVYEQLTDEFVSTASACIAFARARPDLLGLLSRRDIEAVVSNGTPFLFKSPLTISRKMWAFLGTDAINVSKVDQAKMIDLMKYIITYASKAAVSSEKNGFFSREVVDSSVRNLLLELGKICSGASASRDGQVLLASGQNIEMKRGDWICPKCKFMNYARNMKCFKCEESRPKRPGRDWKCPTCNFYNFGRNRACSRCECQRPGAPLFIYPQNIEKKRGDWICPRCNHLNFARKLTCHECDEPIPWEQNGEWRCPQCNFFNYRRDKVCLRCEGRQPRAPLFNNSQSIGTTFSSPSSELGSSNSQHPERSNFDHVPSVPLRDQTLETSISRTKQEPQAAILRIRSRILSLQKIHPLR